MDRALQPQRIRTSSGSTRLRFFRRVQSAGPERAVTLITLRYFPLSLHGVQSIQCRVYPLWYRVIMPTRARGCARPPGPGLKRAFSNDVLAGRFVFRDCSYFDVRRRRRSFLRLFVPTDSIDVCPLHGAERIQRGVYYPLAYRQIMPTRTLRRARPMGSAAGGAGADELGLPGAVLLARPLGRSPFFGR